MKKVLIGYITDCYTVRHSGVATLFGQNAQYPGTVALVDVPAHGADFGGVVPA